MIRVRIFIGFLVLLMSAQFVLLVGGHQESLQVDRAGVAAKRELVKTLGLTDLALWTEARYSRHPSQADLFTSFQDYPGSFDHFPAGSIIAPNPTGLSTTLRVRKSAGRGRK
ncbi:MAG: hypothetical protein ABFS18_09075 [Thermodesulfobacteriota bacterium]